MKLAIGYLPIPGYFTYRTMHCIMILLSDHYVTFLTAKSIAQLSSHMQIL